LKKENIQQNIKDSSDFEMEIKDKDYVELQ